MPVTELPPAGYPWAEPVRPGLLVLDEFTETATTLSETTADEELLSGRVPVAAVGSNASPTVLRAKLGALLRTGLPVARATVRYLGIGHSAHVSTRGYVAAAPFRRAGAAPVTVAWLDAAQLEAMDATEPNYRRVRLPQDMVCRRGAPGLGAGGAPDSVPPIRAHDTPDPVGPPHAHDTPDPGDPAHAHDTPRPGDPTHTHGTTVRVQPYPTTTPSDAHVPAGRRPAGGSQTLEGVQIYDSLHGVIGESGTPLELVDQSAVLSWLAQRLPRQLHDGLDHDRLASSTMRRRIRTALIDADLVVPSGLC